MTKINDKRLSDRILHALELALEQGDLDIAETLNLAMDKSLTRNAGGGMFVERRDYPERVLAAHAKLKELKS